MDKKDLFTQKKELERLINETEQELRMAPEGRLRVAQRRNQYYVVTERGDTKGRYLSKKEMPLAASLAQRDYNQKLLKLCREKLAVLNLFLDEYDYDEIGRVYDELKSARRCLVRPKEMSWAEFASVWQEEPYVGKGIPEGTFHYETRRGELVRSKSELIIANTLMELGVPYKYEHPLKLKNGRTIFPDFTVLPIGQRREVYLEHYGMMDDDGYRDSFFLKHSTMIQNGYIPGVNYIMTFESEKHPINTKDLYCYLQSFLV